MAFIDIPIVTDVESLQDDAFAYLQAKVTGWELQPAHPMTWLVEAIARMAAESAFQASFMPSANLRTLGSTVYGISRNDGIPAVAATTWTASDVGGHIIPAGTAIAIDGVGFTTDAEVTIPVGSAS